MAEVESFKLDHRIVKAPYVRVADTEKNEDGSVIQKFDLRFRQPNQDAMPTAAVHSLEHLLAGYLRDELEGVIDISPMGCRTGFYLVMWNEHKPADVAAALKKSLERVLEASEIPAVSPVACGNYRDHSLFAAKEYAKIVLDGGIADNPFSGAQGAH